MDPTPSPSAPSLSLSPLSSVSSEGPPGPPAGPSAPLALPALGTAFPSLGAFKQAAVGLARPNRLLVLTHRPGIRMALECALTGRKRKQKGGGDASGANVGCGFRVVCELVDHEGNKLAKPTKQKGIFKVVQLDPHNHDPPESEFAKRQPQSTPDDARVGLGVGSVAVCRARKVWDRTERDREVLAESIDYRIFAREMGLTKEQVDELVCWQRPVPGTRTRTSSLGQSHPPDRRDDHTGLQANLTNRARIDSPQPSNLSAPPSCTSKQTRVSCSTLLDVLAEAAASEADWAVASQVVSPERSPSSSPTILRQPTTPATTYATQKQESGYSNSYVKFEPTECSPESNWWYRPGQLPSPSLSPEVSRAPLRPEPPPPSPTAAANSTGTKRKLVLQVKSSALKQHEHSCKKIKQDTDIDLKPSLGRNQAEPQADERELVKALQARFLRQTAEKATE